MNESVDTVVFDVGNVLLRWDPNPLIDDLARDAGHAAYLREKVLTPEWNLVLDAGKLWDQGCVERAALFPAEADIIHEFNARWADSIHGVIAGSVALLEHLHGDRVPLYGLTNFASDKFAITRPTYPFFRYFRDIVVSGEEFVVKPDAEIYRRLLERNNLVPGQCVFIDDSPKNVAGAEAVGMAAIHFMDPQALAEDLRELGFLKSTR